MSSFKGYNFTVSDKSAAPARKRFTDPQAVYDVYDALKNEDSKDADRRAKIRAVYDGALPYSTQQLREKGLASMTNLNFHGLKGAIDARADSIMRLGTDTCDLVELVPVTDGTAGPDDERVATVVAEEFSSAIRQEGHTIPALSTMNKEADLYGIGPVTWPNDDAYAPIAVERGQIKFRGDGPAVSSDHDLFMFESEMPASYLFMLHDNRELAEAAGWNYRVLEKLMIDVFAKGESKENESVTNNGLSAVESMMQRIRMNSFYERHQFDKFDVIHVYVREMAHPRGVTHIIVPGVGAQEKDFLYYKENAYETMDQCMLWLPYSTSLRFAREIRGLASDLVPIEKTSDRLTGAIIDAAFRATRMTLQQRTPGANPTVTLSESGTTSVIAAEMEPVPNPNAAANLQGLTQVRQFISQVGVGAVAGTDLAPVSTGVKIQQGSDQMSKAEAEINERRRTLKDENLFNQRVSVLDKVFAEAFRRFMKKVNGPKVLLDEDPVAKKFVKNCEKRGVTKAMLKEVPDHFAVVTCRDLVLGADGKYMVLLQLLQQTSGNVDEAGRKAATHDLFRLRLGRRSADRYCPVEGRDNAPSDQASFATIENTMIRELKPVLVGPDQRHWSHIPVHAQVLQEIQETVQQGAQKAQMMSEAGEKVPSSPDGELAPQVEDPQKLAQILEAASAHVQEHLAIGGEQLGMKERAKQVRQMIIGLDPTIKALNLAIATQRRVLEAQQEKQQRELEALQKQASEAEMQKALAKVQADKEVGMAKVQADKEVGMAKVQAEREISSGRLQIDREERVSRIGLDTETARARAANEAAVARAGIENRRAETDASIESARRSSEMQEQLVRQQVAADAMNAAAARTRVGNVTGRTRVQASQIANPSALNMPELGDIPL